MKRDVIAIERITYTMSRAEVLEAIRTWASDHPAEGGVFACLCGPTSKIQLQGDGGATISTEYTRPA